PPEEGVTVGFPIVRGRLFGCGAADKTSRDGHLNYARDFFLPSELAAPRLTRGNDTPENRAFIASVLARFPATMVANDARSNRTFAGQIAFDQPDDDYSTRGDWNIRSGRDTLVARLQRTHQLRQADAVG